MDFQLQPPDGAPFEGNSPPMPGPSNIEAGIISRSSLSSSVSSEGPAPNTLGTSVRDYPMSNLCSA